MSVFDNVASGFLGLGIILIVILVVGGVLSLSIWLYLRWKKFREFKVIIFERNGNQTEDDAGIFVDGKTKNKRFFLKKNNVGLDPDDVPYIKWGNQKTVYLVRYGLKNFSFLDLNHTINVVIDKQKLEVKVGEEDVNWAVNAYERQKKLFSWNTLLQYMPFIVLAFVSIIILILFIYFFKDFSVLKDVAVELKEAAKAVAQAKTGTLIVE